MHENFNNKSNNFEIISLLINSLASKILQLEKKACADDPILTGNIPKYIVI